MPEAAFEFSVATRKRQDLVNITRHLEDAVRRSGVEAGIVCVQVPHTTCALVLNEDEAGLKQDILRIVSGVVEPLRPKAGFAHDRIDDNAVAHLTAILLQPSLAIVLSGGRPALGTWQSLFLVELDGPRSRRLLITIR